MLQMTTLELSELIEQEMVTHPLLEEVQPGDEVQEISDNILDQNSDGHDAEFENGNDPGSDAVQDAEFNYADAEPFVAEAPAENGFDEAAATEISADEDGFGETSDSFDEIDYGREAVARHRRSATRPLEPTPSPSP